MTRTVAIALGESKFWEKLSPVEAAWFQLNEPRLCMPFDFFTKSVSEALGRPVFTHEFGDYASLVEEFVRIHGDLG